MLTKKFATLWLAALSLAHGQSILTTFAGTDWVFPGDGKPALNAPLGALSAITLDAAGNPVLAVNNDCMVSRIQADGILKVVAGNGFCGLTFLTSGDGGPATSAGFFGPRGVAFDALGNLYIQTTSQVRKVSTNGTIALFAGFSGTTTGFSGDNGPATKALLRASSGIVADTAGNVFIADGGNHRVRRVAPDGTIATIAGTGTAGFDGDNNLATNARLRTPNGLALDGAGNLYIADAGNGRIRKVTRDGIISSITQVISVTSVTVDTAGNVFVGGTNVIHRVAAGAATATVFAGDSNTKAFSGDGGPAANARFQDQQYVAVDRGGGNLFIADSGNARVRKVTPDGIIRTIAGNGNYRYSGEGVAALTAPLSLPFGIAVDREGAVYFSERDGQRVRKVKNGILTTVAGTGVAGFSGDGGPAAAAQISGPQGIVFDAAGNLYIADAGNGRIRRITTTGNISTLATIESPIAMAFDTAGNLYIARTTCCVSRFDTGGRLVNFAGNGNKGFSGDGGPANVAMLNSPSGVAVDAAGNVFIADSNGDRIRKVNPQGEISTFLGDGTFSLGFPTALRFDAAGNLLIASHIGGTILKATPAGIVSTLAGGGPDDQLGDGKLATEASLPIPNEMAFDAAGNLYIADEYNYRVRVIPSAPATLQAAPTSVSFAAASGGAPVTRTATVTGSLTGLDFAITVDTGGRGNWLTVDATSASTPRVLSLTADPANLAPGSYPATVTITPAAAMPARISIAVTFVVGAAQPPQLAADVPNLSFTFPRGTAANSASLRISNAGGGSINFTASAAALTGGSFLSVTPASGRLTPGKPLTLTVTANPAGLAAGAFSGSIRVQGDAGGTVVIPVVMTVSALSQALRLTQTGMSFTAVAQGGVVPSQTFGVVNVGTGVLNWTSTTSTLSGGATWLQVDTRSGASNAAAAAPQIAVSVNAAGLAPGNYYGLVRITAPGAANTPQVVTVFLEVLAAGADPGAMVQPQELVFNATAGAQPPGSQTLLVYSIGAAAKTFVSGRADGFSVLVAPHEGALDPNQPSRVVIQPAGRFAAGTSTQVLNFQFSDGRVQSVKITVIATPATASSTSVDGRAASRGADGCTPTRLVPALTSLGSSFAVSAGWPVALSVKVTDDCFDPQVSGSVTVSFSNGDVPVTLAPLNDGTWQATWTSGRSTTSGVTLRVDAVDPKQSLSGSREVDGTLRSDKDPPAFTQGSVGSAAFPVAYQPIAPGSFVSIFGSRLADGFEAAKNLPLPPQLGNTQVFVGSEIAPLHFVTEGQINFLVPYSINPNVPQQILVQRGLTYSQPIAVDLAVAQPGIFLSGGNAIVVAVRRDGTQFLVTPAAPAQAGDVLVIYCAGLGPTDIAVAAGSQTPVDRLANTASPVTVTIGDRNAPVSFAGLTPGSSGLYQVNATVPAGVTPGAAVPVTLTVAGQTSRAAPIAVR